MSPFGTLIVASYTALGLLAVGALFLYLRKRRWGWILTMPLVLGVLAIGAAPYIEEVQIASRFEELCKDSGIHVQRKVEAEGYFNDIGLNSLTPGPIKSPDAIKEFERLGFRFIEYRGYRNRAGTTFYRVERAAAGWEAKVVDRPTSQYRLAESLVGSLADIPVGHKLWKQERVIIDTQNNEIVARDTIYKRTANTIDQAWMGAVGSTLKLCPDPSEGRRRGGLVSQTIVPIAR